MKIFFSTIFYKFFQFSKYIGNVDDDSYAFKSVAILSLFISLNFFTVVAYYRCLIEHTNDLQLSKIVEVLMIVGIGALVYFIFYRDKKYEIYFEKFIAQSKFKGRIGTWLTIFYMLGSILFLISPIWLRCNS